MNSELTNLLYARYPKIFNERTGLDSQMSNGIACDDGWFDLVDTLCSMLQFDTDRNHEPQVVAKQIKERGGAMRSIVPIDRMA